MFSHTSFFPCPNCNEVISSDAKTCRYCSHEIDPNAAETAVKLQERINQACNDASTLRNLAGFMWIAFALQFLYALMGRLLFFGLMIWVPIMLIKWQSHYGGIKTRDVDFRSAKRNRTIALLLWSPIPVIVIVVAVAFAIAQSSLSTSPRTTNTSVVAENNAATWQTVTADDGSYSVEFPAPPGRQAFDHTERGYTIHAVQFLLSIKPNHYFVYSTNTPYKSTLNDRLDSSISRMRNSAPDMAEISRNRITQNGCAGLEWIGRSSNYPAMTFHVVESSSRLFVVGTLSERDDAQSRPDPKHFLDSFKLSETFNCRR